MKNKAFTLIELLVAILIIGILAAIALPQYQMLIEKSKYYQLKTMAKAVNEAISRYELSNNTYPSMITDLDIELPQDGDFSCNIFHYAPEVPYINCGREIFGVRVIYYIKKQGTKPYLCVAKSTDLSHPANILCAKEAHSGKPTCNNDCTHYY